MVILGIDPGTALTGYGFIEILPDGTQRAVDYGVIETSPKERMEIRLQQIYEKLSALIFLHRPQRGAVEKLFFSRNVTTGIAVGQARGIVLLAFAQGGIHLSEFTPAEVKQAVVGYGGAEKKQVQIMVQHMLKLEKLPRPDDAADALAVAICCANATHYLDLCEQ